jgi:tetratricopeptide (TPR) repeat protein
VARPRGSLPQGPWHRGQPQAGRSAAGITKETVIMKTRVAILVLGIVLFASAASAQDWKGNGRMNGRVVDEQNKPLEGVRVFASLGDFKDVADATTDRRGDWSLDGLTEGSWHLTFEKEKYEPAQATAEIDEGGVSSPVRTKMKAAFDPNAFIQAELKKAQALLVQKKYADARAVFQGILAKVPAPELTGPMQFNLAQTYYAEGNLDKTIECLKASLAAAPANVQAKLMLANVLISKPSFDEAAQVLGSIDEASITEPQIYLNFAVAYVKAQKLEGALPYLDKAVARFPRSPLVYYYRGTTLIEILNTKKDPSDPARADLMAKIKADLEKYLQVSPNGPEAGQVKKLLAQIAK